MQTQSIDNYPKKNGIYQVKKIKMACKSTIQTGVYEGGFQIWEGGDDLYEFCANNINRFQNKRVLEVGCGQALPSILLKLHGIMVDVADYNKDVLETTKQNFIVNSLSLDDTKFIDGDWDLLREEPYDCIIGADVTYNPDHQKKLADMINANLKSGGEAIISSKMLYFGNGGRLIDFIEIIKQMGFVVEMIPVNKTGMLRYIVASTIVVLSNDPPSDHFFHFNESYTLKETEEIIALEESALLLSIVNGTTKWFELNGESISQCLGSISNVSLYVCETSEQISVISDLTAIIPFLTPYSFSVGRVSRFISKVGETTYEASEASKIVVDLITEFSKQFQKDSDKSVDSVKKMVLKSFGSSAEKVGKMLLKIGQHKLVKYLNHYGIGVFLSKRETATSPAHISNNVQYLSVAKGSDYNNEHLNDVSDFNDNENAKGFIDFVKNNEYINNAKDFVKNNEYIDNAKDFCKGIHQE
ncbi:hypothetical protein QTN25_005055 [Entamoeba marina]